MSTSTLSKHPTIEVIDLELPAVRHWRVDHRAIGDIPLKTEADLIAAAAEPGTVIARPMVQVLDDLRSFRACEDQLARGRDCVGPWFDQDEINETLYEYGVTWDPTLVF